MTILPWIGVLVCLNCRAVLGICNTTESISMCVAGKVTGYKLFVDLTKAPDNITNTICQCKLTADEFKGNDSLNIDMRFADLDTFGSNTDGITFNGLDLSTFPLIPDAKTVLQAMNSGGAIELNFKITKTKKPKICMAIYEYKNRTNLTLSCSAVNAGTATLTRPTTESPTSPTSRQDSKTEQHADNGSSSNTDGGIVLGNCSSSNSVSMCTAGSRSGQVLNVALMDAAEDIYTISCLCNLTIAQFYTSGMDTITIKMRYVYTGESLPKIDGLTIANITLSNTTSFQLRKENPQYINFTRVRTSKGTKQRICMTFSQISVIKPSLLKLDCYDAKYVGRTTEYTSTAPSTNEPIIDEDSSNTDGVDSSNTDGEDFSNTDDRDVRNTDVFDTTETTSQPGQSGATGREVSFDTADSVDSDKTGVIAGVISAVLIVVLLTVVGICVCNRRRSKKQQNGRLDEEPKANVVVEEDDPYNVENALYVSADPEVVIYDEAGDDVTYDVAENDDQVTYDKATNSVIYDKAKSNQTPKASGEVMVNEYSTMIEVATNRQGHGRTDDTYNHVNRNEQRAPNVIDNTYDIAHH